MKILYLKQSVLGYDSKDSGDAGLNLVYFFLNDDWGLSPDNAISSLLNPEIHTMRSNYTILEKLGNRIIMGRKHMDDPYDGGMECSIGQLVDLLKQWKIVCEKRPRYVTIVQDDTGTFTITMADALG